MPAYGTASQQYVPLLTAGQQAVVWAGEPVQVGEASERIQCRNVDNLSNFYSVQYQFDADPGAYELALQHSDIDADAQYVTTKTVTGGLNAAFVGRTEQIGVVMKYARLLLLAAANPVSITAAYSK